METFCLGDNGAWCYIYIFIQLLRRNRSSRHCIPTGVWHNTPISRLASEASIETTRTPGVDTNTNTIHDIDIAHIAIPIWSHRILVASIAIEMFHIRHKVQYSTYQIFWNVCMHSDVNNCPYFTAEIQTGPYPLL